jgi:competence protein ComEA
MGPGRFLQDHFGFTRNEIRLLLVLAAATLAGFLLRTLSGDSAPAPSLPRLPASQATDSAHVARLRMLREADPSVPASAARTPVSRQRPPAVPLDLNTADRGALLALPGIGPVYADRILAHRAAAGGFRSVDDLLAVRGIGPKTLERLRPFVRVAPAGGP